MVHVFKENKHMDKGHSSCVLRKKHMDKDHGTYVLREKTYVESKKTYVLRTFPNGFCTWQPLPSTVSKAFLRHL